MTDPTPAAPRPPSPTDVKPTMLQAVLTFVGGLVLAAGSCAGFLATLNMNRESTVNIVFALGFFASLLAALVGVIMIFVRLVMVGRRRRALAVAAHAAPASATGGPVAPSPALDGGSSWKMLVAAGALFVAALGSVALMVAVDPNPMAVLFLLLAAASGVGSLVTLVLGLVRYGRGR